MIGCPTGAIHRASPGGQVVINDATCIGCATCANSCPYDNIRMVEVRGGNGTFIRDTVTNAPIVKATNATFAWISWADLPANGLVHMMP
jgi:Fe-S-cluster-containing dehydrogenase component